MRPDDALVERYYIDHNNNYTTGVYPNKMLLHNYHQLEDMSFIHLKYGVEADEIVEGNIFRIRV